MNNLETDLLYPSSSTDTLGNKDALKEPSVHQLSLLEDEMEWTRPRNSYRDKLIDLLSSDLDFHGYDTSYASHDFHPFPAKFPPQLPRKFIQHLTQPGDVVLDPMMGSGTTVVEAYLTDRIGVGVDIDPLAKLITQVKTTAIDSQAIYQVGAAILENATIATKNGHKELLFTFKNSLDQKTLEFIEYWFALETQVELLALTHEIKKIPDNVMRAFFELALSGCVITKSGGVSLAFDLAHTRPHRAKIVYSHEGKLILGEELLDDDSPRVKLLTKNLRSALVEFRKRYQQNAKGIIELNLKRSSPHLYHGDAQKLPLDAKSVDLIVTSPPYVSNAIDYMRAHKFSLVWLGYPVDQLGGTRKQYIGGEGLFDFQFEKLPPYTTRVVTTISQLDPKKGQVLHRYYSEMTRVLQEMYRVLKADRAVILVVASSIIRNRDVEIGACLAEIGGSIGFEVPKVGVRRLDRNRRMLPAGKSIDHGSQIQNRMHEEFVIGFYKP